MNKVLVGALIAGGAAIAAALFAKKKEKKYAEVQSPEEAEEKEDTSEVKEKIRIAAAKVVNWILTHKDDIEAATLVISLASSLVGLNNKIKEGRKVVSKTPNKSDFQKDLGNMTAENALDHVKETKKPLLIVDSDDFGYVISPEVAA